MEQAAELRKALPAQAGLADFLAGFAKQLTAAEDSADGVGLTDLFKAVDQWLGEVAEVATRHDPQLDLRDALPKVLRGAAVAGQVAVTP